MENNDAVVTVVLHAATLSPKIHTNQSEIEVPSRALSQHPFGKHLRVRAPHTTEQGRWCPLLAAFIGHHQHAASVAFFTLNEFTACFCTMQRGQILFLPG